VLIDLLENGGNAKGVIEAKGLLQVYPSLSSSLLLIQPSSMNLVDR
jgi:hypothetical protein